MKSKAYVPDPENPRVATGASLAGLATAIYVFRDLSGLVVNRRTGHIVCGHQRTRAGKIDIASAEWGEPYVCECGEKGKRFQSRERRGTVLVAGAPFAIREVDWPEEFERAANVTANNPEIQGAWSKNIAVVCERIRSEMPELSAGLRVDDLLAQVREDMGNVEKPGETDPDEVPEAPAEAKVKPGELWTLGAHRLLCGDSTRVENVKRLMGGGVADLCCTDPPYCSGGFQESGKANGSVGTDAPHKQVANDKLSTRGYQALLKTAISNIAAPYLYAFTDWRMWVWLFDVAESSGYGVRSMIVWNKGSPGMGRGWRAQHELILWGCKKTPPFDKHSSGIGNVIDAKRTGNEFHTTEKPVEVVKQLLEIAPFVKTVADPFAGSGTLAIAAEQAGRVAFLMELDALYCDVIVKRWENFTGKKAKRE